MNWLFLCFVLQVLTISSYVSGAHVTLSRIGHREDLFEPDHHHHGVEDNPGFTKLREDGCPGEAECVLPVQCPAHVQDDAPTQCTTFRSRPGVCCSTGQNHTDLPNQKKRGHHIVRVDPATLGAITRRSRVEMADLRFKEMELLTKSRAAVIPFGSPSYGHFRNSKLYSMHDINDVMGVERRALEIALATKAFKERQGITNKQLEFGMIQQDLRPTVLGSACLQQPSCPPVSPRHRNVDGSCNNLRNPSWGVLLTPYSRLLPPSYHDGIWAPRVSEDKGQPLSSPRLISTTLLPDIDRPNPQFTLMLMQFGQFISHDITQSIDTSYANGSAISCCTEDGSREIPPQFRHFTCFPILIPKEDKFFSQFNQGCMNFVRSVLAPRHDCTLGYAQQMNKVTHYIDGSAIYGSTMEQQQKLRAFEGGRLKVFEDFGREFLPLNHDPDACLTTEQGSACYASGDTRTNQMVSLVVLHTVFLREHNRIAGELQKLNPHWNDEHIFLETRRIVTAELQVITYKEFLPALLGPSAMNDFGLNLETEGSYSHDYDQRVEPSVLNEFASAAFRFGHSMVEGALKIYGLSKMEAIIDIPEVMFHPARLRKREFYDQLLSTLTTEPIQEVDNSLSDSLTHYMFRAGNPFGVDLASINIQRGRDHGLRSYNDYRQLVGQPRIKSFAEFQPELGEKLRTVYASVDDVDLWLGGLLEPRYGDGVLGLTFREIIGEQFSRLKKGDKYFFEHDPAINPGYFTQGQLQELRKISLARVICDNKDGILLTRLAPQAFRKPNTPGNEFVHCSSPVIPSINLLHWRDL